MRKRQKVEEGDTEKEVKRVGSATVFRGKRTRGGCSAPVSILSTAQGVKITSVKAPITPMQITKTNVKTNANTKTNTTRNTNTNMNTTGTEPPKKRGRGRPRKIPLQ